MSENCSVLLVDDSKFARLLVKAFIQDSFPDWQIDEAVDAGQACEMTKNRSYDYFVIDFNMPGMDGIELGALIRKAHPDSSVALLTANIQTEIQKRAEALGIDFLAKPPTQEKIAAYFTAKVNGHD
jgi:CheY-like chemotaxis protein